jgi:hypothetical protein
MVRSVFAINEPLGQLQFQQIGRNVVGCDRFDDVTLDELSVCNVHRHMDRPYRPSQPSADLLARRRVAQQVERGPQRLADLVRDADRALLVVVHQQDQRELVTTEPADRVAQPKLLPTGLAHR